MSDLLKKFAERERNFRNREFLAPFTGQSKTAIVKMDGVNYVYRIVGHTGSGFGIFQPIDFTCAKFIKPAEFDQLRGYFDVLPKVNLILCYECEYGWVAYPVSLPATQRLIGLDREIIVRNVTDCERFDVVVARFDGAHFWFDEIFAGADVIKSSAMRDCFVVNANVTTKKMRENFAKIKGATPEDEKSFELAMASWKMFIKSNLQDEIKKVLENSGGKLVKYILRGDQVEISWNSRSGQDYVSIVKKDSLDVISAGICLSGEDHKFHLKDLPFIIQQGEDRDLIYRTGNFRAFDMNEDNYDGDDN